jgi:poly(A) polymerase
LDPQSGAPAPIIVARPDHPVSRTQISGNALKVLYRLRDGGYQAFLVGGCVRDLLIGIEPKDFDVATDASPEEVRRLFRNCRLIGRRFRLAHVRFGYQVIEVATFRAAGAPMAPEPDLDGVTGDDAEIEPETEAEPEEEAQDEPNGNVDRAHDARGRLLRDNLYGTIDQDVWRRDFTCNALYYNIEDFSIVDYVGGVDDVRARTIRLIGDPETRYREDPVRMLRAVRFEAKLGFTIHESARAPFARLAELLGHIPPARLLDEFLKLFLAGFGQRAFDLLREHGLFAQLFPATAAHLDTDSGGMALALIRAGLADTDRRVAEDRPVTPMFLFAVMLFGPVSAAAQRRFDSGTPPAVAIAEAVDEVVGQQNRRIGIPKRFSMPMRDLLALQPRFHRREGRRVLGFLAHPRFRAAYDFLLLRAQSGGEDPAIARWWTELLALTPEQQRERVGTEGGSGDEPGPPRRRRRRRGGRRNASPPVET